MLPQALRTQLDASRLLWEQDRAQRFGARFEPLANAGAQVVDTQVDGAELGKAPTAVETSWPPMASRSALMTPPLHAVWAAKRFHDEGG